MGKSVPRTSALIVSAIRKLREAQGSTPKEIMNFITSEYAVPGATLRRQIQSALKRGLEYGILKCQHGHYALNTDATGQISTGGESSNAVEKCRGKRKYRKCKKTRRCARGCTRRRRRKRSSCGRKRRHRKGCSKRHRAIDGDNLALSPMDDCRTRNEINPQRSHHSRISNRSCTNSRSRSRSGSNHSSGIDARETSMDRRRKGAE